MARPCKVCRHPQRDQIDRALLTRGPYREIAKRFGVSPAGLHRHSRHQGRALATVAANDPELYGRAVLSQVRELTSRALQILDRAEQEGDFRAAAGAIREARGCLELVARLEGGIVERHAHVHAHAHDDALRQRLEAVRGLSRGSVEELRSRAYAIAMAQPDTTLTPTEIR